MIELIINVVLYGLFGGIAAWGGLTWRTWEFWVLLLIVTAIDLTSNWRRLSK